MKHPRLSGPGPLCLLAFQYFGPGSFSWAFLYFGPGPFSQAFLYFGPGLFQAFVPLGPSSTSGFFLGQFNPRCVIVQPDPSQESPTSSQADLTAHVQILFSDSAQASTAVLQLPF